MTTRMLILKLSATLAALIAGGCNWPSIEQPTKPQQVEIKVIVEDGKITVNDATIDVKSTAGGSSPSAAESCSCGCGNESCRCSRSTSSRDGRLSGSGTLEAGPQVTPKQSEKPVVLMMTSFRGRGCPPCDAAKAAWEATGNDWPFALKIDHEDGWMSPTFIYRGTSGREFRRQGFSTADELIQFWRANQ